MTYLSTKTFGHELGLSACFRQWRAASHCKLIHGYALSVKLEFSAETLDARNWVVDFGDCRQIKAWLQSVFDHTLLVARDDPHRAALEALGAADLANVLLCDDVGCEAFAKLIHGRVVQWLHEAGYAPRVSLRSVEVREHGANSAIYMGAAA